MAGRIRGEGKVAVTLFTFCRATFFFMMDEKSSLFTRFVPFTVFLVILLAALEEGTVYALSK